MIRKISLLFVSILLLLNLSACHGKIEKVGFSVPEEFDETKDYEITFWAKNDSNKNQVAVYKQAIGDFEKIYPNIKIKISLYTDYTKIYNDVITNISTNTTPNVCITYPDHIATYITGSNTVVPLDDLLVNEKYGLGGSEVKFDGPRIEEMLSEFLNEGIIGGHYYDVPFMRSSEALYINKDFVEKLGYEIPDVVTWDFIWEVSDKATEKNKDGTYVINNQQTLIPFIYKSTDNMLIQMLKQKNGAYSNDTGEILIFNDDTKDILKEISKHVLNGAFSTFKTTGYPANFLNQGQCIFAVDSTAGATWMGCEAPLLDVSEESLAQFETVVRPVPQYDINNISMISQGPSICIFNKSDSNEVLASWLFAQYLLTNDIQIAYSQTEGYLPVTSKALNSDVYKEYIDNSGIDNLQHYSVKIDATKIVRDYSDKTFVTPVFNGSASLRNAAGQMIEESVKALRRKKDVNDEFFNTLFADTNSLYRLDQVTGVSNRELGELPLVSKMLLGGIAITWVLIGIYYFKSKKKGE